MGDGAGTLTYGYDTMNRLTSDVRGSGPGFTYVYDSAGNLTQRTYPSGANTYYKYDGDSRLCSVNIGSSATCIASGATTYAYNIAAGTATKTQPSGVVTTSTYDHAGRLTNLQNKLGANTVSGFHPTLDGAGNPTKIVANPGEGLPSETQTYTYFGNERLQKGCYDSAGT